MHVVKLLDGRKLSKKILSKLKKKVKKLKKLGIKPGIAILLIGRNTASEIYVTKKIETAINLGINAFLFKLSEKVKEKELLNIIHSLNKNKEVHGIIVQLPIPKHLDKLKVLNAINPEKDVDGFTSLNLGKLVQEKEELVAATPLGCIKLLEAYKVSFEGRNAVIVGHSIIVGKPLAFLLLNRNATVTICHKFTKNLKDITKKADLLFVAVGKPKLITVDMVRKNSVIVDIGINKIKGKIVGDVDFEKVKKKVKLITPVPGGIGPMTIAMLLENTVLAAERQCLKHSK